MAAERVVVTGLGCCTPRGSDPAAMVAAVLAGAPVDASTTTVTLPPDLGGGSVPLARAILPDPSTVPRLSRPFPDRRTLGAIVVTDAALASAGLPHPSVAASRIGLVLNTTFHSDVVERYVTTLLRDGPSRVSPMLFARTVANAAVGELSRRHALRGPSTMTPGSTTVGYAYDLLTMDKADVMLCVGAQEMCDAVLYGCQGVGLLSSDTVPGDSMAAVVLERESIARSRAAPILAEVLEYVSAFSPAGLSDARRTPGDAILQVMRGVLVRARLAPDAVDTVIGMADGDAGLVEAERTAVRILFGPDVRIVWPKHVLGQAFAAAGEIATVTAAVLLGGKQVDRTCCLVNGSELGGGIWSVLMRRDGAGAVCERRNGEAA